MKSKKAVWHMSNSQFEKSISDLEHQDMGMAVIMNHKDPFNSTAHSEVFIVVL